MPWIRHAAAWDPPQPVGAAYGLTLDGCGGDSHWSSTNERGRYLRRTLQ